MVGGAAVAVAEEGGLGGVPGWARVGPIGPAPALSPGH